MTRTRRSAKTAGTRFERLVAGYLAEQLGDPRVERRARNGARDRGDITGVSVGGHRVVVECKDTSRWTPGAWLAEAEAERVNDAAAVGLVVAKRRGKGDPGSQVVLMTLADLTRLLQAAQEAACTPRTATNTGEVG